MDTLELRVPVTESEQEFLYLVVKAAIHQYRLHRRGRIAELANPAETLVPDRAASDTQPDSGATRGDA